MDYNLTKIIIVKLIIFANSLLPCNIAYSQFIVLKLEIIFMGYGNK